jgi:Xaa-Pro aminopeptidase
VEEYRPGMTENDVGKIFMRTLVDNGADWVQSSHIMCGADKEGMFDTGHHFEGVTIHKGDYLSLDIVVCYKGYWADNGRIINVGPVSENFRKGNELLWQAFDAGVEAAKPGARAKEVWEAVTKVYTSAGWPALEMAGHSIGLDIHEPPVLSQSDETVLEPGMTFELEPASLLGFRKLGGDGPLHYENLLIITERGCDVVHGIPRGILQVSFPFE